MERLRPWLRRSGWAYIVLAVALAAVAWRVAARGATPTQPNSAGTSGVVSSVVPRRASPETRDALVHIAGAVRKPGLYRMSAEGRVRQAITAAGGPTAKADVGAINLAAPVRDGQKIVVPERVGTPGGSVATSPATAQDESVSLSSATVEQLDGLDGIGPTLAARIVAWRDEHGGFDSVDQLLEVPGIGQARLDALRSRVTP